MTSSPPRPARFGAWKAGANRFAMDHAPAPVKDAVATVVGQTLFWRRRGRAFRAAQRDWQSMLGLPRADLLRIQSRRTRDIISLARTRSPYYRAKYAGIASDDLDRLPVLDKEELRAHIDDIVVPGRGRLRTYYTGGTTGASVAVRSSAASDGERFARQEAMWAMHGYRLGRDRIAWFSGRHLIGENDVAAHRFWRNNHLARIRYYSTFHLATGNLPYYVADLAEFRPAFLCGFPSAIGELARYVDMTGDGKSFELEAIFTTSETLTGGQREAIEQVFNCPVRNQYASSEGAPFILECRQGRLHMDVTSGVFEVVDGDGRPAVEGETLVTSFYMKETPIIRYRIGDRLTLSTETRCPCGWDTPLVASIDGRASDFIEVPGRGRIFASQIGDCVKHLHWVVAFRCGLEGDRLRVEMVADRERFEEEDQATFLSNIRERMGNLAVELEYVEELPRLPSGKQSVIAPPRAPDPDGRPRGRDPR